MSALLVIIILGVVEGLTEFVPVSSTGHMILVEKFINSPNLSQDFMDTFLVVVQFGAILSVVLYFWKDINPFVKDVNILKERTGLWSKICVGVIPAAVIGFLLDDYITEFFFGNVTIVAIMLVLYGILFLIIEKFIKKGKKIENFKCLSYRTAFIIGIFQCLAMIPGTSRSGATIIGGLILGLSRGVAAEYSFFLAIPTMMGATLLKVFKNGLNFTHEEWTLTAIGLGISFVVAYLVIKWFMSYIKNRDFKIFGIYRTILGIAVLLTIF